MIDEELRAEVEGIAARWSAAKTEATKGGVTSDCWDAENYGVGLRLIWGEVEQSVFISYRGLLESEDRRATVEGMLEILAKRACDIQEMAERA